MDNYGEDKIIQENDIVLVVWVDAWHNPDEIPFDLLDDFKPINRYNVGYLASQSKESVVLVGGLYIGIEGRLVAADRVLIPMCMIKKIVPLVERA